MQLIMTKHEFAAVMGLNPFFHPEGTEPSGVGRIDWEKLKAAASNGLTIADVTLSIGTATDGEKTADTIIMDFSAISYLEKLIKNSDVDVEVLRKEIDLSPLGGVVDILMLFQAAIATHSSLLTTPDSDEPDLTMNFVDED